MAKFTRDKKNEKFLKEERIKEEHEDVSYPCAKSDTSSYKRLKSAPRLLKKRKCRFKKFHMDRMVESDEGTNEQI